MFLSFLFRAINLRSQGSPGREEEKEEKEGKEGKEENLKVVRWMVCASLEARCWDSAQPTLILKLK